MTFHLAEQFPEFSVELAELLERHGQKELAKAIPSLTVIDRCRCGDDFCATMYTVQRPRGAWGEGHRTLALDPKTGFLIIDVVQDKIVEIEVLYRNEIRDRLQTLMPLT